MKPTLAEALQNYARGICGGLLFSLPMLYTMEIWWAGIQLHPPRQALYLLVCLVLLISYNRYAGLRCNRTWAGVLFDAVEALGLGILLSYALLALLGRFDPGEALPAIMGKTVVEAGLVSIGISVGKSQLGASTEEDGMEGEEVAHTWHGQVVFGIYGATIVAASVGPTEEIQQLADAAAWRILVLALLSILIGLVVLYLSNFREAKVSAPRRGLPDIVGGSMISYFVALLVATVLLYVFGRFDGLTLAPVLDQIVVLGFPASLGASAGRLMLQSS